MPGWPPPSIQVSILVFLELAPGPCCTSWESTAGSGFNPCFSGTRARTESGRSDAPRKHPVSILVFLELAPGRRRHVISSPFMSVSILVFLELAPGRQGGGGRAGSGRVSILVFLELAPGLGGLTSLEEVMLFQSLFFWNSRPDADFPVAAISPSLRFNPCFSGTRARTQGPPPRDRHI